MAHPQWLDAYVLHRRAYRETSYLVDFFSRQTGKVSAVAKGVRNSKSDRKSLLQPFQPLRIQLSGKSELKNLTQAESQAPAITLQGDALFCGMYVNELTNRIMPAGLESELLYDAYTTSLAALAVSEDTQMALRRYEFSLLTEMGLMPDWGLDARQETPVEPDRWYRYESDEGMVATASDDKQRISGTTLLMLANGEWQADSRRAAKHLSRQILTPLLGPKPLKSRELFASLRRKPRD